MVMGRLPGETANGSMCEQSPNHYRVDSLTYFDMEASGVTELPCMYAGTMATSDPVKVDNGTTTTTNHYFFWYFPHPDHPKEYDNDNDTTNEEERPLVIFMNGGPGASSMTGLFEANGPLRVVKDEKNDNNNNNDNDNDSFRILYTPQQSWQFLGDLLYVDQPVGTGWSYGNRGPPSSMPELADEFVSWLRRFYREFPSTKPKPLVLTGESFAGKYVSFFARAILDHNDNVVNKDDRMDLRVLSLSDPLVDVETERMHQHDLGWAVGLYDDYQTAQVETLRRRCEENGYAYIATKEEQKEEDVRVREKYCKDIVNYVVSMPGGVSHFDVRYFVSDRVPPYTYNELFVRSARLEQLKADLHIISSSKEETKFEKTSAVAAAALLDRLDDTSWLYSELLARGLKILINVGAFDPLDGVRPTLEWTKAIDLGDERAAFDTMARKIYRFDDDLDINNNIHHPDRERRLRIGGYYRETTNFTLVVVPQAGHMVPVAQRQATGKFVQDLLTYGKLRCDADSDTATDTDCESLATDMCDYMNHCNGHGTCSDRTGQCTCEEGYLGADCTVQAEDLTSRIPNTETGTTKTATVSYVFRSTKWTYFRIDGATTDFALSFQGSEAFDVYVKKGTTTIPDPADYDAILRRNTAVTLTSATLDVTSGWVAALYVPRRRHDLAPWTGSVTFTTSHAPTHTHATTATHATAATQATVTQEAVRYYLGGSLLGSVGTALLVWFYKRVRRPRPYVTFPSHEVPTHAVSHTELT